MSAPTDITDQFTAALADRYRIERLLGAGGMATVYLAHDVRHDRKVALKVLKPELAAVIGAQRFLAEIRTTANLQHPHILSLFDSGEIDGSVFYVMPFVDGESLRDRLTREGQLPVADAVRITREVAEALQHAHAHGVIHRDIKPENILLQSGHAVVADFGIALAVSKTGASRLTETGMSLGTPQYMSPEQAMGERTLDARTDVYALGCVLYEMLAGEPPFTGPTAQAIVARVLTEEPRPLLAQRKTVPLHVAAATETALAKLPADRFASASEFAAALGGATTPAGSPPSYVAYRTGRISRVTFALAAALALTAALAAWGWLRPKPAEPVTRTYVKFPAAEAPTLTRRSYTLLPDGSALVYVGKSAGGGTQLWLKKRNELHAAQISGTDGATNVFTSPDGQWIGFIADAKLKKVPISGGVPTTLADASCASIACLGGAESGTWMDDGHIAFVSNGTIVRIPANGGTVDTLVGRSSSSGLAPILPAALPGSRGVLFTACTLYCNRSNVMVFDLTSRKVITLVEDATLPEYSPTGHLLYVDARGAGMAVAFDPRSLSTRGAATPVLDRVAGNLATSANGTLVYSDGDNTARSELVLVSRDGHTIRSIDTTWRANFATLALSPDGKRIAASIVNTGQEHLWIKSIDGDAPLRLTFGNDQSTTPTWTADGASVLFTRFEGTRSSTFMSKRADGSSAEQTLKSGPDWVIESVASRDGNWWVYRSYLRNGRRDISARRVRGDTIERVVVATPSDDYSPTLSPDAKWLAYASDEGGGRSIWVVPFPDPQGAKWQLSAEEGIEPLWSRDGREVFYVTLDNELVAVPVSAAAGGFTAGKPQVLMRLEGYRRHTSHRAYDVTPDNQHFLMIREGAPLAGDLVIVDNWFSDLTARLQR
jgi:serine/threonine-protein kinase